MSGADLLLALHALGLITDDRYPRWWRHYGEWWVAIEAILTQQTRWEKVEASVNNLVQIGLDTPAKLLGAEVWTIAQAIAPAGFYNQKADRIVRLLRAIERDFGSFEGFAGEVSREWLLEQKGIGFESADSILCYGCRRAVMVVDSYTQRLLSALGNEFDDYNELQSYLMNGVESEFDRIYKIVPIELELTYAYFHGLIVEFCKKQKRGAIVARDLLR
ncbi:3-methyladenine DNA glycosylase [Campylobacterota bacterium]|nr:3-methyladenine DNA glycosylase [Campylobacterota bacterium]